MQLIHVPFRYSVEVSKCQLGWEQAWAAAALPKSWPWVAFPVVCGLVGCESRLCLHLAVVTTDLTSDLVVVAHIPRHNDLC